MGKTLKDHDDRKPLGLYSKGEEFEVEDVDLPPRSPPLPDPDPQPEPEPQPEARPKPLPQQTSYYPPKDLNSQPKRYSRKELKQNTKKWEEDPTVKRNGLTVMKKSTKYLLITFTLLFFVLLTVGVVWSNVTFQKFLDKDFAPKTTVEGDNINITTPVDARTEVNNNFTIINNNNNTIIFPEEFTEFLEDLAKDEDSNGNESS